MPRSARRSSTSRKLSVDKSTGMRSDQTVILTAIESAKAYPDSLRRVSYFDAATNKRLKFLTNNFALPAREPMVQPNGMADDLGWKAMTPIQGFHRPIVAHRC